MGPGFRIWSSKVQIKFGVKSCWHICDAAERLLYSNGWDNMGQCNLGPISGYNGLDFYSGQQPLPRQKCPAHCYRHVSGSV